MDNTGPEESEFEVERAPLERGTLLCQGMYTIDKVLGEGGFAITYLAHQGRWKLAVCIKEFFPIGCERRADGIHPSAPQFERKITQGLQAFSDEAAALARFNHPGIVRVLGTFEENRTAYLVQEVLEGMTLGDGLDLAGRMSEAVVLKVAQQVGHALLMVHAAGLVHSDLKPENIFLTRQGRYVLLDFGLTRGFLSEASAKRGGRGLSSGYAPPEQYELGQQLTPATDVYGFAATLWALLTGMNPPDAQDRLAGHMLPSIQLINPGASKALERALLNALVLDFRRRTPGVREFLHQLGLDSTPKSAFRPPPFEVKSMQRAHPTGINVLMVHSTTNRLFSAGRDGIIKTWSWPDLELLHSVEAHGDPISALAISGKGTFLVSGSETGELKLWETTFQTPGTILSHEGSICTSLKMRGEIVAAGFADGRCCLFAPSFPEPIRWFAHAGSANCLDFHPQGAFLVSAGSDKIIRFWNYPQPELIGELTSHEKSVQCAQVHLDGTSLLSGSSDHSVRFWDLLSYQQIREIKGHPAIVIAASFTCVDEIVVSLSGDHCLRAFYLSSSRMAFCSEVPNERARVIATDLYRPLIATGGGDGQICVWEFPLTF